MEYRIDLKNYKIIKEIGYGGYSRVFLVQNQADNKFYAAKVLMSQNNINNNDENSKVFTREVNLLSSLQHIAILQFVGFSQNNFDGNPNPTILTEYSSNGSLRHILNLLSQGNPIKKWNSTTKYIIIYGVAAGMTFLHQNNIIHRDLKPENILLDDFYFPKICDFGLSKSFNQSNRSQQSISTSTLNYMAPEMTNDDHHFNELVDVFSFGIIMFEIVTEKYAFSEIECDITVLFKIKNGYRPSFPQNLIVNEGIKELIQKCWSQNPSDRPNFASIVEILKKDEIAESMNVNLDDFHFYIDLVNKTPKSYKPNFIDFITNEVKSFISNSKSSTFKNYLRKTIQFPQQKLSRLSNSCRKQIQKAEEGDDDMMFVVGNSLIEGNNGFQKDIELGLKFLEEAIEHDNEEACERYSNLLLEGKIIPFDLEKAQELIEKSFLNESSTAKLTRAKIELCKENPNYSFVKKILIESINKENTDAMVQYAKLMMKDNIEKGLNHDFNESFKYFKIAAENENSEGMAFYSYFLKYGFGVCQFNYKEAVKYAKLSCDLGNMTGAAFYSDLLCSGLGIERDDENAVYYAKLSCDNENSFGMSNYGCLLIDGIGNLKKNRNLAYKYFKMSADLGNFEGLCNYGNYYVNRFPQNADETAKYFKKSMELGCPFAPRFYGLMFLEGKGVELNPKKGNEYLKYAADLGDSYAMLEYSRNLWNGVGIEIDKDESLKYLKMGVDRENKECYSCYGKLILDSLIPGKDPIEGWKYLEKANPKYL